MKKSKDKLDNSEKRDNITYNLFVLKENIHNFDDLQRNFKVQIENPNNIYDPNREGVGKILDTNLVFAKISYGSVVVHTEFSKVKDNIDIRNKSFYYQSHNKNSLLFSEFGGYNAKQDFYAYDCCKIINYSEVLKIQSQRSHYLPKAPKAKYFLLINYYNYEIDMVAKDMKYRVPKRIQFFSDAYPINQCGQVERNNLFRMEIY